MDNKDKIIEEMAVIGCVRNPQAHTAKECAKCDFKNGQCNSYRHAEALYNAGYRKIDEFAECRNCTAWSGTDCTRHPYTQGCLKDENNIKRQAVKEFAEKLRKRIADTMYSREGYVDYDDTMEVIDEILKEYEK